MKFPLRGKDVRISTVVLTDGTGEFTKEALVLDLASGKEAWTLLMGTSYDGPERNSTETNSETEEQKMHSQSLAEQQPAVKPETGNQYSVQGDWNCVTSNPHNTKSNDHYRFESNGNFESTSNNTRVSGKYEQRDQQLSLRFLKIERPGRKAKIVDVKTSARVEESSSARLVFTSLDARSGKKRFIKCTTIPVAAAASVDEPAEAENPAGTVVQGGDFVTRYAANLAAQLMNGPHPACQAIANHILTAARSSAPGYIRQKQVESMFDKAPDICLY